MTEQTPIERAAGALASLAYDRQHCGLPSQPSKEQFVDVMTASYTIEVNAVLMAVREPSDTMLWAYELPHIGPDGIKTLWQAMIDAAYTEGTR